MRTSGLHGLQSGLTQEAPIPLLAVRINVSLVEAVVEVEVVQDYVNREEEALEVVYFFPVEESAAVTGFKAEVDGRMVEGQVREVETAVREYKEAVDSGRFAGLLTEVKPDVLHLRLGRLGPGGGCRVRLTYLMEAAAEEGTTRVTLPTTLFPRYCPDSHKSFAVKQLGEIQYSAAINTISHPTTLFSMQVKVSMSRPIQAVTSPTHTLVQSGDQRKLLTMKKQMYELHHYLVEVEADTMDRDVVVLVETEASHMAKLVVEESPDGSSAALVTLIPCLESLTRQLVEVVFLMDCSGSMQGQSITLAREALVLFLHSLPSDSTFNIVRFGSSMEKLFPESQPYSDSTLASALLMAENLKADLGGTEILDPLNQLLIQGRVDSRVRQIFVLTDGAVSNSMECIRRVGKLCKASRVFTVGVGPSVDRHLVSGIARAGGGSAVFTSRGEEMASKVLEQLKQALAPAFHLEDVDWEVEGSSDNYIGPKTPRAVHPGARVSLFRLFTEGTQVRKVTLTASNCQKMVIEGSQKVEGEMVHKMLARKMIQELEEEDAGKEELIKEVALKYKLTSRFTSFVAVDPVRQQDLGTMTVRQVGK